MLALHALWTEGPPGTLLLWAEDGDLPAQGQRPRGRRPAEPRPRPHPFAADPATVAACLAEVVPGAGADLGPAADTVLWLPGTMATPDHSPQLIRTGPASGDQDAPDPPGAHGLWPFIVPAVRLSPSVTLDVVPALATLASPAVHPGASVTFFAAVAGLALEYVAAGAVLPDLRVEGDVHLARWTPAGSVAGDERLRLLSSSLPAVCRALDRQGVPAGAVVRRALDDLVDAACRDALAARPSVVRPRSRRRTGAVPATDAWLDALSGPSGVVAGEPEELAKLERLVAEWRAGAAVQRGPWRLCLRLVEPPEDVADQDGSEVDEDGSEVDEAGADDGRPAADERWRVDLLLQATDDLSLLVEASEVWRSGTRLRRASRSLQSPQEVLLGELGRCVRVYPELGEALRRSRPTGLELDLDGAHRFLTQAAPALEVAGFGVHLPAWWRRGQARLGVTVRASAARAGGGVGGGLLSQDGLCEFDWAAAVGDEELELAELQRLAALKAPLVRVRGQWVELHPGDVDQLVRFLDRSAAKRADRTMSVAQLMRLAAGVDQSPAGVPVVGVTAEGWLGSMLSGDLESALEVRPTPANFVGELRPYQQRGVAWLDLLERLGLGSCLADDMGLGKTATVLALLQARRDAGDDDGPTLVVCPTSVVGNWAREAERFTPSLSVLVHHGTTRARDAEFRRAAAETDVVITSYALATRDRPALAEVAWGRLVLDEAQNVKNAETKQTKAVRSLPARHKVALTGTPVENHLGELWSIMEIVNPGLLGSASSFRNTFAIPIERYREEEAAERLRRLTRPFVLRRLKTDRSIIADLPDKLEMKVLCNLTREQVTLYQAVVDEMLLKIASSEGIERRGLVLATMLRLKQVCNHPAHFLGDGSALAARSGKLDRTTELLDEVMEMGERALVFTQFAEMGHLLVRHLTGALGRPVAFLHGGVSRKRRDEMVASFQDDEGPVPVMVLSLKAGGTGLNLTAANHVIHFDRWWNPAVENQATDRAFRIGQRRNVQVRKLVCAGTLEDRIDQLIESKRELAERVVGAGESWLTELSTDELTDVFRLSAEAAKA